MKNTSVTGILLAGGKSSRMGRDKGFIRIGDKPMAQHVLDVLSGICDQVIIVANNDQYKTFGYPVFHDIIPGCGPMGGIYTGLLNSQTEYNLVLSCDIPFIESSVLKTLLSEAGEHDAVIPVWRGRLQPLCALYKKNCAGVFENRLAEKSFRMTDAVASLRSKITDLESVPGFECLQIANINTPRELESYQELKS